jgi:ribosomal protein S18 acetylase RimI-like enzyme
MSEPSINVHVSIAATASLELVEAFNRLIPQLSKSAPEMTHTTLEDVITAPGNVVLLARDGDEGGQILGTLTLVFFRIPTALRAWIEDVVVDQAARGRGVGEALTREAVRVAQARGAKTCDLTSRASRKAAHRLYEKCGFHVRDTNVYRHGPKPVS